MNELRVIKTKKQLKTIRIVLLFCSLVIVVTGLLVQRNDVKTVMLGIGAGLFASVFIMRLFKREFGYKPTREEIEEEMFNTKNKSPFRG